MSTPIKRISSVQKVKNLWKDICVWLKKENALPTLDCVNQGASKKEIKTLEEKLNCKLPQAYRASLAICNGGAIFGRYEYLSTNSVFECWKTLKEAAREGHFKDCVNQWNDQVIQDTWWDEKWIPFALDSQNNLLCLDLNPGKRGKKGQIIFWEQETNQGPYGYKGSNFTTWLEHLKDQLIQGELEIISQKDSLDLLSNAKCLKDQKLPLQLSRQLERFILDDQGDELAELLDNEEISPNSFITSELSLIRLAAEKRKLDIVKLLVERGADVNIGEDRGLRTPLFEALWGIHQNQELVKYLITKQAHINASTTYDGTPLHAAVLWGNQHVTTLLLENGANIEALDSKGRTPLDLAKKIGKNIMIEILTNVE